jgi:hypothetical protein
VRACEKPMVARETDISADSLHRYIRKHRLAHVRVDDS